MDEFFMASAPMSGMSPVIFPQECERSSRSGALCRHGVLGPEGRGWLLNVNVFPSELPSLCAVVCQPSIKSPFQMSIRHSVIDSQRCFSRKPHKPGKSGATTLSMSKVLGGTKHYWPDDPLVAEATARIKPRKP